MQSKSGMMIFFKYVKRNMAREENIERQINMPRILILKELCDAFLKQRRRSMSMPSFEKQTHTHTHTFGKKMEISGKRQFFANQTSSDKVSGDRDE